MQPYAAGAPIWTFYRMSGQPEEERFLACADRRAGALRPRMGLSEGWIPAEVREDFDPGRFDPADEATWVRLRHLWPHLYDRRGAVADLDDDVWAKARALPAHVAPRAAAADRLTREEPPQLGLVAVRWGGWPIVSGREWGSTGAPPSDTYFAAFLRCGLVEALGLDGRYEVWTIFVEDASDLQTLAGAAHLIFGHGHPVRRARHVKAAYFLYHTAYDPRFFAAHATATNEGAAYVERGPYTWMIRAFERAGIRTEHPHSSHLYDALAAKSWQHALCLDTALRLPAGLAVARGDVEADLAGTAREVLDGLEAARRAQHRRGLVPVGMDAGGGNGAGDGGGGHAVDRGVVKLGYSWEALDVKHWRGEAGLRDALAALTRRGDVRGTATGQPHDADPLIVQEYVPHDCELRLYFVEGVCELVLATRMRRVGDGSDFGDLVHGTPGEARYRFFAGDEAALSDALARCRALSRPWLDWLAVENGGRLPPAIRLDFFARRVAPGAADVRMLEICEQGFSWLEDETLPPKVFAAVARSCIGRRVLFAPHPRQGADDATTRWERRPAARPTLRLALTDDGVLAFDTDRESVHRLNRAAALILTLCDGRREAEEIEAAVRGALDDPAFALHAWLIEAVKEGLVTFGRGTPATLEMNAEERARAAARLRGEGLSDPFAKGE